MEYTEEQKEQFKQEFAAKRRRQIMLAIALVPILVLFLAGSNRWGEAPLVHLPFAFAVIGLIAIVGGLLFSIKNWRCPACGKYLGRSIGLRDCPSCGIALRSPAEFGSEPQTVYTEEQQKQFKRLFAAKQRRQGIVFLAAVSVAVLGVLARASGRTSLIPLAVILMGCLLIMGALVFSFVNWRCPACGKYLGKGAIPRYCPKCGIAFR